MIAHPAVAVALGALLGVALTFVAERAARFVTPVDPMRGFAMVVVMMGARFFVCAIFLAIYYVIAPAALAPFGIALALSFVTGLFFEAVRIIRPHVPHTSA